MLHAHCFVDIPIDDGCFSYTTSNAVPCGAIEEVNEICETIGDIERVNASNPKLVAINLKGHGCILMASNVHIFDTLRNEKDSCFYARKTPEII